VLLIDMKLDQGKMKKFCRDYNGERGDGLLLKGHAHVKNGSS
jgi:hypothetical protein